MRVCMFASLCYLKRVSTGIPDLWAKNLGPRNTPIFSLAMILILDGNSEKLCTYIQIPCSLSTFFHY